MQSLINRALEAFLRDAYGDDTWDGIASAAGIRPENSLTWKTRSHEMTAPVIVAASGYLKNIRESCWRISENG